MAWIESHQALGQHPKVLQLSKACGWSVDETIGKLHRFWWWCLDYATDGRLERFDHATIGSVFGVSEGESNLVQSLTRIGFLDSEPEIRVHDWWDYAGRFLQVRYKRTPKIWKEIKRFYGHSIQRTNNRTTTEQQPTNNHKPNQPNLTNLNQPNLTKPTSCDMPSAVAEFEEFWKAYPRKVGGKKNALRAWGKAKDRPAIQHLLVIIGRHRETEQWKKDGGQYIPYPATWLNRGMWADDVTPMESAFKRGMNSFLERHKEDDL